MTHSPLPWVRRHYRILDADGERVASVVSPSDGELIIATVTAHEKMRKALEEIAHMPTVDADCTLVDALAVDVACDALGLCRECGSPLGESKHACDTCGAPLARAALAKPAEIGEADLRLREHAEALIALKPD